ncbi:Crp/Fnr family transcriptional regulator [Portibacter marinus]|uniref:Crp/Fnr family transcriptional regulator n=1 Tax=Portibacter marinus TaxID=2898660 RepID=UPI001F42E411|nr:hypothetical protein [Portibacter marinus]
MTDITKIKDPIRVLRFFDVFFNYVKLLVDIPEKDKEYCRQIFNCYSIKKGTMLESEGTLHEYHNFIVSGHMRNFYRDDEGQEVTTDINAGPRFFTSYYHFINGTIANENLQCITDCEILRIHRKDVENAKEIGLTSQEYTEKVLQFYLESAKQRVNDFATLTGKERYLKLINHQPSIVKNVPLIYVASYIGINAGSLSRIRQELQRS